MANSKVTYTAGSTGAGQTFAVTFSFINRSHVDVEVNGTSVAFTWNSDSEVAVTGTVTAGNTVLVIRVSSLTTRLVDYVDGSNLSETDLDTDSLQAFYLSQEAVDAFGAFDTGIVATDQHILVANGTKFNNVIVSGDITLSNTGVTTIGASTVETAMLEADAIDSTRLADDAVDSEHYTDGSIDTVHIADANITTVKIADDAVTGSQMALFDDAYEATAAHMLVANGSAFDNVAITGDIAVTNAGVTSIVAGVVVNADINASAAIDATKIHNGTVTNTEFSYLNGVTSDIQTQINGAVAGVVSNVQDDVFRIQDNGDNTKEIAFEVSGVATGTTRTVTMPDSDVNLGIMSSNGFSIAMAVAL